MEAVKAELAEIKAQLNKNSGNSHKPPSTDFKTRPPKGKSDRSRGGQPGHPGHYRMQAPEERLDEVEDCYAGHCGCCGTELTPDSVEGEPERHQVSEVPPVQVKITEYRIWRHRCPKCRKRTKGALPRGVTRSAFGPALTTLIGGLIGRYRLSRREAARFMSDMLGVEVSLGVIVEMCRRMSESLKGAVTEVEQAIRSSRVVHVDETGWKEGGKRRWLWVAVTESFSLFMLSGQRSQAARRKLIGEKFGGIVISDRFSGYSDLPPWDRALCHAHLKRDFQAAVDRGGDAAKWGQWALREQRRLFDLYYKRQAGELTPDEVLAHLTPIKARFGALLNYGEEVEDRKVQALCRDLKRWWLSVFTFVELEEVEGTNNRAEQRLRPAVIWRKTCHGTGSPSGNEFVERLLTVSATCAQQGRNLFSYLLASVQAAFNGEPPPMLLVST